jgi:D-alanyl-lipoteichoic acid acyltransferase DltB (MBOAT superfamily)
LLFYSLEFALFFLAVFLAYHVLPMAAKKPFLLIASLWFYAAWDWRFLGLILLSSGTDFLCGRLISAEARPKRRKAWLLLSLAVNLGILGFFKYFNFFLASFHDVFPLIPLPGLKIILPVGISFFTFQSLSYTIDIYRGQARPAPALDFFLFVAFFPQLLSGPIVRASEFLPQLRALPPLAWDDVWEGLLLFARGFAKKVFLAALLARFADPVFAHPRAYGAWECLLAAYAFAFQIYWDFSGYTDMARGCALALGFRFPENFRLPYLSASPREFWRRWHMTLSAWLRDYLYKSLGGDRHGRLATLRNLFVTMALGGLWHGAQWTFVIWGCYHGVLLMSQRLISPPDGLGNIADTLPVLKASAWKPLRIFLTFHLICLGWIFFRSESLTMAMRFLGRLFSGPWDWTPALTLAGTGLSACAAGQLAAAFLHARRASGRGFGAVWDAAGLAAMAVGMVFAFIYSTESAPFLYFQF